MDVLQEMALIHESYEEFLKRYLDYLEKDLIVSSNGRDRGDEFIVKEGRKFDKVLHVWSNGSVSVHSFIARKYCNHKSEDLVPGDVMKPAGMNAAAAHSRGNIFAKDYTTFAKWFGVKYLI